jgi:hypothetical protein
MKAFLLDLAYAVIFVITAFTPLFVYIYMM